MIGCVPTSSMIPNYFSLFSDTLVLTISSVVMPTWSYRTYNSLYNADMFLDVSSCDQPSRIIPFNPVIIACGLLWLVRSRSAKLILLCDTKTILSVQTSDRGFASIDP